MSLREHLSDVIDLMNPEPQAKHDFDAVDRLLNQYPVTEICTCIADPLMPEFSSDKVGVLFDIMAWSVVPDAENTKFMKILYHWIERGTERQSKYALAVDGWFYYQTTEEMISVFTDVGTRYPRLKDTCDSWIRRRLDHDLKYRRREAERPSPLLKHLIGQRMAERVMRNVVRKGWKKY